MYTTLRFISYVNLRTFFYIQTCFQLLNQLLNRWFWFRQQNFGGLGSERVENKVFSSGTPSTSHTSHRKPRYESRDSQRVWEVAGLLERVREVTGPLVEVLYTSHHTTCRPNTDQIVVEMTEDQSCGPTDKL